MGSQSSYRYLSERHDATSYVSIGLYSSRAISSGLVIGKAYCVRHVLSNRHVSGRSNLVGFRGFLSLLGLYRRVFVCVGASYDVGSRGVIAVLYYVLGYYLHGVHQLVLISRKRRLCTLLLYISLRLLGYDQAMGVAYCRG